MCVPSVCTPLGTAPRLVCRVDMHGERQEGTMAGASCTEGVLGAKRGLHNRCTPAWWRGRGSRLELRGSGPTASSLALSLSEPRFLLRKMGLIVCPACLPTGL